MLPIYTLHNVCYTKYIKSDRDLTKASGPHSGENEGPPTNHTVRQCIVIIAYRLTEIKRRKI